MTNLEDNNMRTIKLRFPYKVKQISDTEIEVPVNEFYGGVFNQEYCLQLEQQIGKRDAANILDDAANAILLKEITSQIRC